MHLAHITLPTRHVERTRDFLVNALGLSLLPSPANSPVPVYWLDLGSGQSLHVFYVEDIELSRFECEFGRHIALFHPLADFPALKARLADAGAVFFDEVRRAPFERFFFREPVNGYYFEVIDVDQTPRRD